MAETIAIYKFTYQNGNEFKLEQSVDGGDFTCIIEMTENGDIGDLFEKGVTASLKHFFSDKIDDIATEMKL